MTPKTAQARQRLLRATEVADLLAISTRGVWRLRQSGRLPGVRVGGCVRFRLDDVLTLQREGTR
jgi:excisionase family DNA binding protein